MKNKLLGAQVEAVVNGRAFGSVAERLLANGFKVNELRQNATTLRHEEWQFYDQAIVDAARPILVGVNDLSSRGLVFNLDGMANKILMWETGSASGGAQMGMKPNLTPRGDRKTFTPHYLPLVCTFDYFNIDIRDLNSSRKGTMSLDKSQAADCGFNVADKIEEVLFRGASSYKFGDAIIYGYCDHPDRNQVTLATQWDASAATGAIIVDDVLAMRQALLDDYQYGPCGLYVPPNYASAIAEDYKTYGTITVAQRIAEIEGIEFVKVAPKLADDNVVLVQLSSKTVEIVIGMDITNIPWESPGGFELNQLVLAIMVPRIKSDDDGRCGVAHLA